MDETLHRFFTADKEAREALLRTRGMVSAILALYDNLPAHESRFLRMEKSKGASEQWALSRARNNRRSAPRLLGRLGLKWEVLMRLAGGRPLAKRTQRLLDKRKMALQAVFEKHEHIAQSVAARNFKLYGGIGIEDYYQQAVLEMLTAIPRYNPDSDSAMGSYLYACADNQLRRWRAEAGTNIRIPHSMAQSIFERGRPDELPQAHTPEPPPVKDIRPPYMVGLDAIESVSVDEHDGAHEERARSLNEALAVLPADERRLLSLLFGLDGEAVGVTAAAKQVGLSVVEARKVEARALLRLKGVLDDDQ